MLLRNHSHTKPKAIAFTAGFIIALMSFFGMAFTGLTVVANASGTNCDDNAILKCGFSSTSNFISTVKSNNSGNGHSDLQAVYAHYGLEPADYDKFVTSARPGLAYSDGRIVVDGQTVSNNAKSIGRIAAYQGSGYFSTPINGTTYYGNTNQKAYAAGVSSLPVMVLFNAQGVMQFAVLNACGNPEYGTNVTPSYSCNALNESAVSGEANTYKFTTSASAGNNATISKVVYTFGDGSSTTETSPSTPVTHTYTSGGTYTAKVTVYVHLPGNQNITVASTQCQKVITIQIPTYLCVQLNGAILDQSKMSYSFTATAKYSGGATFTSADFNFGDGNTQEGVKPASSSATTITVDHTYTKAATYNASAVLHFMANGQAVTAAACPAMVTPTTPPTPECKPGVPVGSPDCSPCATNASVPADSAQCMTPPPVLPNTGAGDTIAIFAGVAVAGFLVYRQLLFRKHKAAFTAAQMGNSPLPLGDPLSEKDPLVGTPFAPKRRTFRRRRPF
jgi:hypothetical protein